MRHLLRFDERELLVLPSQLGNVARIHLEAMHDFPGSCTRVVKQRDGDRSVQRVESRLFTQLTLHEFGGRRERLESSSGHELPRARIERDSRAALTNQHAHNPGFIAREGDSLHPKWTHAAVESSFLYGIETIRTLLHMNLHTTVTVATHA